MVDGFYPSCLRHCGFIFIFYFTKVFYFRFSFSHRQCAVGPMVVREPLESDKASYSEPTGPPHR